MPGVKLRATPTDRFPPCRRAGAARWRWASALRHGELEAAVAPWLLDTGSLTLRLRQSCGGRFSVELLGQRWQRPAPCERRLLGLGDRAVALVRQVALRCGGEAVVYARTVLPVALLRSRYRHLARLGGRPLGEVLFRDRSMRRGAVQLVRLDGRRWPEGLERAPRPLWGRRSLFRLGGAPLLVSEFFVPPPPRLPAHRFRVAPRRGTRRNRT